MTDNSQKVANLNKQSSSGNYTQLEKLFNKNQFSQKEIDEAFRECISNYSNNKQNENYKKTINLLLKKTEDINYCNPDFQNTTILMYAIDQSKEVPTDLIIECFKEDININIKDNNSENAIFHLIKNNKFSQKIQCDFFKDLLYDNLDFNEKNKNNETIMNIIISNDRKDLITEIQNKKNNGKFSQNILTEMYNKGNFEQINKILNDISKKENSENLKKFNLDSDVICINDINLINKNSFEYNKLLIEMRFLLSSLDKIGNQFFNSLIENNATDEYQLKIIKSLLNINSKNNNFCPSLFINKLIMFYQLDNIKGVEQTKNALINFPFLNNNILLSLYKSIIYIDMLIQRNNIKKASNELIFIENFLQKNYNNLEERKFVIPYKDMGFEMKDINTILNLYRIYIEILENNTNNYDLQLSKLTGLKIQTRSPNIIEFYRELLINIIYLNNKSNLSYKFTEQVISEDMIINNEIENNIVKNDNVKELENIYMHHYKGILCLHKGSYYMASLCFLKCLNLIIKKSQLQLIKRNHFYPTIIFNLALSYFFNKDYLKSMKLLYFLLTYSNNKSKFYMKNPFIYYRLALTQLELLFKENKKINMLYISFKKNMFILKGQSSQSKKDMVSSEIIENFKKAFILVKNNVKHKIYFSSLINLVFCHLINQNYTEAIYYLKKNKSENSNDKLIVKCYLMQCYLFLNKTEKASEISEEITDNDYYNNKNNKFFERMNQCLIKVKGFNFNILINLIKMCIAMNKRKELEKNLFLLLNCSGINISTDESGKTKINEELPSYIINAFVYYYCYINRKDLAFNILKTRKIKELFPTDNK